MFFSTYGEIYTSKAAWCWLISHHTVDDEAAHVTLLANGAQILSE
jgi:hypothetical protein